MSSAVSGKESGSSIQRWIERRGFSEVLACALAFLAFAGTLGYQLVFDDKPQIVENPAVHAWRFVPGYFTSHAWAELFPGVAGNYYRPIFLLWLRVNHALFGTNPFGWHLTTILCHVLVTYLVLVLVRRLAGDAWVALGAAILFAVHPIHIESVAWVSGVTDPLLAIFLLGAFLAYLRFRENNRVGWIIAAMLGYAAGLLAKEIMVVFLPLIFLFAWLHSSEGGLQSRAWTATKHSLWFVPVTVLYLGARAYALKGLSHEITPLDWSTVVLTWPSLLWMYVRNLVFPAGLSGFYGVPYVRQATLQEFIIPTLLLVVVASALAVGVRRATNVRLAMFACCWSLLTLAPALYLPAFGRGDIFHDRYLYVPSIGFVVLVAMGLRQFALSSGARQQTFQVAGIGILGAAYLFGTLTQEIYWANDMALYARAVKIAPTDSLANSNLANELLQTGQVGKAIALYTRVLDRDPNFWLANYNLGYCYYRIGNYREAEKFLRRAISITPEDSDQFMYLGLALARQGRMNEAAEYVQKAIKIRPSASGYHFIMGSIRQQQKDDAAAGAEFELELKYNPKNQEARRFLDAARSRERESR